MKVFRAFEQRKQLAAREVAGREEAERKTAGRHRDRAQALHLAVRGPHPWYGDCLGEEDFYHSFKHQPPHKSVLLVGRIRKYTFGRNPKRGNYLVRNIQPKLDPISPVFV